MLSPAEAKRRFQIKLSVKHAMPLPAPNANNTCHFQAIGFVPWNRPTTVPRQSGPFFRVSPTPAPNQFGRLDRRSVTFELLKFLLQFLLLTSAATALAADTVERWGMYEIALRGLPPAIRLWASASKRSSALATTRSLANGYDLMKSKNISDWGRFFCIVHESDSYAHLRSIHNSGPLYDHSKPRVTHVSLQSSDMEKARDYVARYHKPVIYDECKYEGNIPKRWGNISAREMVRRFWLGAVSGAYVGHGETYLDPNDTLWWSKGGTLHGQSPARIAYLRKILEDATPEGLNILSTYCLGAGQPGRYYLFYFDVNQPVEYEFDLTQELPEKL
jgi:hypothetical protein